MKNSTKRRLYSLLLAFAMIFTLAPTALLDDETEGSEPEDTTPAAGIVTDFKFDSGVSWDVGSVDPDYYLTLEPNSDADRGGVSVKVLLEPTLDSAVQNMQVSWSPANSDIVGVSAPGTGHVGNVYGKAPGKQDITVNVVTGPNQATPIDPKIIHVTVSGIKLSEKLSKEGITIAEREMVTITGGEGEGFDFELFGNAVSEGATFKYEVVNQKQNIYLKKNGERSLTIEGREEGSATIRIICSAGGRTYTGEIPVTVTSNDAVIPYTEGCSTAKPLKFSILERLISDKFKESYPEGTLASVIGLSVPTSQGVIYLGYKGPDDTGAGAGSSIAYYSNTAVRGPYIKDLTFVPNPSFTGEKATISFTAQGTVGDSIRTLNGRIEVTIEDVHTDIILTAQNGDPLKFSAENFAKVCQEQTGASLSYVIFTLPPAGEGVLYRDYKNELDYGSRVTASERYDRKGVDDITFVPALGFVGQVAIGYAGYSITGNRYNGQLIINVTRPLDESIQYQDYGGGEIVFNGGDFDNYSIAMTGESMRTTGWVSFTPPPASQGTLYRSWRNGRGTVVAANDTFSLTQLNSVTFVAANGFDGVVRIPFTGEDRYGAIFSGTVELHIQAGTALNGDIRYTCQPSQSVKLQLTDFANLCQSVTGDRLYYVTFQSLPDYTQGALFYNRTSSGSIGTRVTTASKYFNSAVPYLSNVSFWAAANFSSVEIPFTMASVNGQTFTGLLVISGGEGAGGGIAGTVNYTTSGQQPVTFNGADFDAACRQATNSALNYLRFSLPGSGQGILYYDYRTDRAPTALDPSTALYLTGNAAIDKVTFVPASGASGVCYIPFTATAINGRTFQGNAAITIRAGAALGSIVYYSTGGAPVYFQTSDLTAASGIGQPTSIRFTGMPGANQGRVYYQYVSPTQYSWLGNTSTVYSVTGDPAVSNLTFIPKAGYQGVVNIPYVATGIDGTTSAGTIEITVTLPNESVSFDDLGSYSAQTRAAIDYLASQGVVNGIAPRRYDPGASIRRGDFCLMLSRAFRFNVGGTGRSFTDVPGDAYYAQAVNQMYALGIVNGVGGGLFQPEASISRQDAAVMVRRALDKAGMTVAAGSDQAALANYSDRNRVDTYAQEALGSLVRAGLFPVNGSQLNPKTAITRADMALLLHRAMTNFS